MKILNKLFLATALMLICAATAIAQPNALKFNANHKFKIVQFTDIHWKYGNPASDEAGERMAEVLDADIFSRFKADGIFNRETAEAFRREILSRGGTEHPAVLFRRFMGRDPDQQALLKRMGLTN